MTTGSADSRIAGLTESLGALHAAMNELDMLIPRSGPDTREQMRPAGATDSAMVLDWLAQEAADLSGCRKDFVVWLDDKPRSADDVAAFHRLVNECYAAEHAIADEGLRP